MDRKTAHPALSPSTLVLASLGSLVATFALGRLGLAGTLAGAAVAPVLVALSQEVSRRSARRAARAGSTVVSRAGDFRGTGERLRGLLDAVRWRRVAVTGAAAFGLVVAAVTVADLLLGESVASGRERTFIPSGGAGGGGGDGGNDGEEEPPPAEMPPREGPVTTVPEDPAAPTTTETPDPSGEETTTTGPGPTTTEE
jgi:hypothetical protein